MTLSDLERRDETGRIFLADLQMYTFASFEQKQSNSIRSPSGDGRIRVFLRVGQRRILIPWGGAQRTHLGK